MTNDYRLMIMNDAAQQQMTINDSDLSHTKGREAK